MTVLEALSQALEAARQRREVATRMDTRRMLLGLHAGGGTAISRGTVLDPMRQVDECIDAEADDAMLLSQLDDELDSAYDMVCGMSVMGADEGATVCCRHFILLEGWDRIADETGHTETECQALMEMTIEWADGVGVARLTETGRALREGARALFRKSS